MIIDYVVVLLYLTTHSKSIIMKNVLQALFALLILIFASSCAAEKITTFEEETAMLTQKVDTIITFDPVTFEETIMLVVSDEVTNERVSNYVYRVDTIITFDADTYEETIEIVKTKVPADKKEN